MLEGNARHLVNGNEALLKPRDIMFIRPHDIHDYASADGKRFSFLNIAFTVDTTNELFAYLNAENIKDELFRMPDPPKTHLTSGEASQLGAKMKSIIAIDMKNIDALKTELRILLFYIFTKYFFLKSEKTQKIPLWLEELCAQMRKSENFTDGNERIYKLSEKSREHISRSMKKYMGVTVTEFVNDLRLNYIAGMLKNSNLGISQIVYDSGFNNMSYASECFKAKYGTTMSRFRKS